MIAVLQPHIPHYREEFFLGLAKKVSMDNYIYNDSVQVTNSGFKQSKVKTCHLKSFRIGALLIYNPFPFLKKKYTTLVLMGSVKHVTTWLILFLNIFLKKKIILWGHGISINRYEKEAKKQPLSRVLLYKMAGNAWFYTDKELRQWKKIIPSIKAVSLNNTFSGVDAILNQPLASEKEKENLKKKHGIKTDVNLIICVRFSMRERRADLLIELLQQMDPRKYGLIVIGDGKFKPNFSGFSNVYEFGFVYDEKKKKDLFAVADLYVQPGWIGLSGVEAMAYGLPVFTLKRSGEIAQCVEYNYLINQKNSMIFSSITEMAGTIKNLSNSQINELKKSTKNFARENFATARMNREAVNFLMK